MTIEGLNDSYCEGDSVEIEAYSQGSRIYSNYSFIDTVRILEDSLNGKIFAKINDTCKQQVQVK